MISRTWIAILTAVAAALTATPPAIGADTKPPKEPATAILGAQTREIALLRSELEDMKEHSIMGLKFWEGRLAGRRAVVVRMASGKVNAAMVTTLVAEHFEPEEIIVTGIAGGLNPTLGPGDIVIANRVVHHDVYRLRGDWVEYRGARNPIHGGRHPVFLEPADYLLQTAQQAAKQTRFIPIARSDSATSAPPVRVITGTIATGDAFIASDAKRKELRDEPLEADCVEMEGAAVAQVCRQLEVPCVVIRCMSDMADNSAVQDLESFADVAAANSAHLVREILRLLAKREQPPSL